MNKASLSAYLVSLLGLSYSYSFIIAKNPTYYSLFLMLSGLFALPVMVVLFRKLKNLDDWVSTLAFVLGLAGSFGMILHGGYDLANTINPPAGLSASLPSQIDPRGLLSFGITGLAILKFSYLMGKDKFFPKNLSVLGYLSGALLIVIYLARLTVLSPSNPVLLYPVLLEGFVVNPLWYIWLGAALKKGARV